MPKNINRNLLSEGNSKISSIRQSFDTFDATVRLKRKLISQIDYLELPAASLGRMSAFIKTRTLLLK